MSKTKIVGFHSGHDVAYAVLEDGVPVLHEELERFERVKEPPGDGLLMFFENYSESPEKVGYFTHGNPLGREDKVGRLVPSTFCDEDADKRMKAIINSHRKGPTLDSNSEFCKAQAEARNRAQDGLPFDDGLYYEASHHESHAANAFFSSPYDKALIITLDGGGFDTPAYDVEPAIAKTGIKLNETACTIWYGKGNKIRRRLTFNARDEINIGDVWDKTVDRIFQLSTGHPIGNQAGSVMAMASYADPERKKHWATTLFGAHPDHIDGYLGSSEKSTEWWYRHSGSNWRFKFRRKLDPNLDHKHWFKNQLKDEQVEFNVAGGLQLATEVSIRLIIAQALTEYMKEEKESPGDVNLCLAGGVSLNSVAMGKIWDWYPEIKDIYIPPVPYDSGLAIGSAQLFWHSMLNKPRIEIPRYASPYLGRTYSKQQVIGAIESQNLSYQHASDSDIVDLLDKQNIVAVYGGGSESGRRALGNRSILADPRSDKMKDIINDKVKHRKWYRPFAPSILRSHVKDWFERDVSSPYMQFVIPFKEEVRDKVPAVVHVDGTARLQTVCEYDNRWYHGLLTKWYEKSGVPILLNTSFNDREPIVEKPEHAVKCFMSTNIDYLYFYDYGILLKKSHD